MKTIEQVAFDRYISDQKLPEHKRMQAVCYIDWANLGAIEAQRWIPMDEELPERNYETVSDQQYTHTVDSFLVKTRNGKVSVSKRISFMNGSFCWKGSGTFSDSVVSWRPIERE